MKTNFKTGLTQQEAEQRILTYGLNKIKETPPKSFYTKFFSQFKDYFIYILLVICLITFCIGIVESKKEELVESILILIIIFSNACLGFFYENRKEFCVLLIQNNTKPYTKVLRNKTLRFILREEIVLGDIVFLEAGDIIPADLRLIETHHLKVNESILTGETLLSIAKNSYMIQDKFILIDSPNLVFMDTTVMSGRAQGVVIKTGMDTQIGQIAKLIITQKKEKTPLEKNIQQLSKILIFIIFILIIINFILDLIKNYLLQGQIYFATIKSIFLSSIILAVAVIPEGLLAIITIILASGIQRLIKKKAIVKNLKTLETLGAINIICTDKTGTLTQNKMNVRQLYFNYDKIQTNSELTMDRTINKLLIYGILCNNIYSSSENVNCQDNETFLFDPVDQSFIDLGNLYKLDIQQIQKENKKIKEFPFDNNKKIMMTIHQKENEKFLIIKGAAEIVFKLSRYVEYQDEIILKNKDNISKIEKDLDLMSSEGYKVLGISYIKLNSLEDNIDNFDFEKIFYAINSETIFLGAFGIEDPLRPDIIHAIQKCKKAFIDVIMITGDHLQTAIKIASDSNIFNSFEDLAINGETLDLLSEEEFNLKLPCIKVYARTTPEHKLKIIQAWQKKGKIVGMIGDGVNDAPSIKKSDIGISMGIIGTDITKKTSDIILIDDNFNTIPNAIQEGRKLFDNIKKSIIFLLSCNIGEIFVILLNTLLGYFCFNSNFVILSALQILWVNLVTDSLVAIALGLEYPEEDIMKRKPRLIHNSLLNKDIIKKILIEGMMIGLLTFIAAFIGFQLHKNNQSDQYGQTFAFMVLSLSQLIHVFNFRSFQKSLFNLKTNWALIFCFFISFFLQITILLVPFFRDNFRLSSLSIQDIIIILLLSIVPLFIIEIKKMIIKLKLIK
ncbi:MAG: cation-transporting P-type ATPase [Phytoplasma sp.]|uniref:cation-translocating P-type ATPase n=1 Tax=Phytoplasma sp. TaxID=2155 RepID=UPI002B40A935|nr:cation-transporting P-type ATPase [Phytoplasma sp.]WRH06632.1 MAG: cation-transporting P-type ATPase [Phytoplasma sp.]